MTNGRDETEDFEATSENGGDRNECPKLEKIIAAHQQAFAAHQRAFAAQQQAFAAQQQAFAAQQQAFAAQQQAFADEQQAFGAQQKLVESYEELTKRNDTNNTDNTDSNNTNRNDTNNTNTNNTAKNNSNNTASNNTASNNNNSPVQTDQDHSFQSPGSNEKSLIPEPAEDENYLQILEEDFENEYMDVIMKEFPGIKSVPISDSDFDLVIKYCPTTKEEFLKIVKMDERDFELYGVPLVRLCDKYKRLIAKRTTKEKRTRKGSKRPKKN